MANRNRSIVDACKQWFDLIAFAICLLAFIWYYIVVSFAIGTGAALGFSILIYPLVFLTGQGVQELLYIIFELLKILAFSVPIAFSLSWSAHALQNCCGNWKTKGINELDKVEAEIRSKYRITCYQGKEYRIEHDKNHMKGYGDFSNFEEAEAKLEQIIASELEHTLRSMPESWEVVR